MLPLDTPVYSEALKIMSDYIRYIRIIDNGRIDTVLEVVATAYAQEVPTADIISAILSSNEVSDLEHYLDGEVWWH